MIYFLSHNDIQDEKFECKIENELSKRKSFIYLTATQNLKNIGTLEYSNHPNGIITYTGCHKPIISIEIFGSAN